MASNLERLKAKKASNQKKEADLSTSFSIDAGEEDQKAPENVPVDKPNDDAKNNASSPTELSKEAKKAEPANATEKESGLKSDVKEVKEAKNNKTSKDIEAITPIKTINGSNDIKDNNISRYNGAEKNLGIRLASEEDKRYLNMVPLGRSMTKKSFFIELMEKEFDNAGEVDINDPEIERFRNSALKTASMTISVPEDLIDDIKKYSAKHMMKPQRYIAYVLSKARNADQDWK